MHTSLVRFAFGALATLAASSASFAQDFNVDVGGSAPANTVPSPTFGGAANRPGVWSAMPGVAAPTLLTAVDGTTSSVTASYVNAGGLYTATTNLVGASPDDTRLMSDFIDTDAWLSIITIQGLVAGNYDVYTYAMAADDPGFRTDVNVLNSPDPTQTVGGLWPNAYVQGVTHARHNVSIPTGGSIIITAEVTPVPFGQFGTVSGFQIVKREPNGSAFCFGDGLDIAHTANCPCANVGAPGNGCANSANAAGANLAGSGDVANDDVSLNASGMPATTTCIFLQGDGLTDTVFGDGVLCVGGTLVRLRVRSSSLGAASFPDATDSVTLSQRGGVTPGSGVTRVYQTYYRNAAAAFCPPETFNVTNGWRVAW